MSIVFWNESFIFLSLQNYLREQPDNIKSVNLVAETTKFLNILYGNINANSVALITQVFETLVEFTSVSCCYFAFNLMQTVLNVVFFKKNYPTNFHVRNKKYKIVHENLYAVVGFKLVTGDKSNTND